MEDEKSCQFSESEIKEINNVLGINSLNIDNRKLCSNMTYLYKTFLEYKIALLLKINVFEEELKKKILALLDTFSIAEAHYQNYTTRLAQRWIPKRKFKEVMFSIKDQLIVICKEEEIKI